MSCCPSGTKYIHPPRPLIKLRLMGFQPVSSPGVKPQIPQTRHRRVWARYQLVDREHYNPCPPWPPCEFFCLPSYLSPMGFGSTWFELILRIYDLRCS
jgi:hypothetical protein